MFNKKTIKDLDIKGRNIIVRVDFNVPLDKEGKVMDKTRIIAALPTIRYLIDGGARVILLSHLGRPKGEPNPDFSLKPLVGILKEELGKEVVFADDDEVVGEKARTALEQMRDGDIVLLENVRFRGEETKNNLDFAKDLASLGDIFVNDAFGSSHRAHSSTVGIGEYLPAYGGLLIEKELKFLGVALENPRKPFIAILGGAKVSDKIGVINKLLEKVDTLIIGGGMAYTFLKAQGYEIGRSLLEKDKLDLAKEILNKAEEKGVNILLPQDVVISKEIKSGIEVKTSSVKDIPKDHMGLDIGEKTYVNFANEIKKAKMVIWNGPMGVFEIPEFSNGTREVAKALVESKAITIIGGGDSAAALVQFGYEKDMTHISTGGGASLEFLEGKELPGIKVLQDK